MLQRLIFNFSIAVEAISHNTLRAGLTSLGIIFGVASVIAMLAIGKGAEQEILEQMKLLGSNNIIIKPLPPQSEGKITDEKDKQQQKPRFSPGLRLIDALNIERAVPNVRAVCPEIVLETMMIREGYKRSGKLVGIDSNYFSVSNFAVREGKMFSETHERSGAPVCIIGSGVKKKFFSTEDPIGKQLKCGSVWLTVIGVLQEKFISDKNIERLGIRNFNMDVFIPLETMLLRYRNRSMVTNRDVQQAASDDDDGGIKDKDLLAERKNMHQLDRIIVQLSNGEYSSPSADILVRMMQRRHNGVLDVEITIPELLLQQEQRTKNIFNIVLGAIASISLIVGGIGIMNIMLASVLERIREIGVRRALGATKRDIVMQFLGEAVSISVAGGVTGIILGVLLSYGIEKFAGIVTIVSVYSALLSFFVSFAVGVLFGYLPARRAAEQDPVECLRYE